MSRDADHQPIWARPEPRGRGPLLTRDQIAAAALAIADEEGVTAVSMRNVAARLGAGTMTLYNYVRTKDELLALMDDALMAECLVADLPGDWREALLAVSRSTWDVLVRHPWAVQPSAVMQIGPNTMRHFEQSLAAIAGLDLAPAAKMDLLTVVDSYVFGNVLRTAETLGRMELAEKNPDAVAAVIEYGTAQLESGEFPHTVALMGGHRPGETDAPSPPTDREGLAVLFEKGLHAVVDGAVARFTAEKP